MSKEKTNATNNTASAIAKPVTAEVPPASSAAGVPANPAADQYHGKGGSYVLDELTQTRRPNETNQETKP